MMVTPEMASSWLKLNHNNRNITSPRVELFVRLIREGKWVLTHQGIGFYCDGNLADGQTRLSAIARAGIPVWMLVTEGLPRESIHAIDGGRPRSVRDVLHFIGISLTKNDVSVVRMLWMQYRLQRSGESRTVWDASAVDTVGFSQFVDACRDAVIFATPKIRRRGLSHASVVASVASAWFTEEKSLLSRFQQLIAEGTGADQSEQAAIRLRDFLQTTTLTKGGTLDRQELFVKCCGALRAFIDGRTISRIVCRPDSVFPIPDLV